MILREMVAGDMSQYAADLQHIVFTGMKKDAETGMVVPPCVESYMGTNKDMAERCGNTILLALEEDNLMGYISYSTVCSRAYITALKCKMEANEDCEYQLLRLFIEYIKEFDDIDTVTATVPMEHTMYVAMGFEDTATVVRLCV